ncbi:hypothetical protein [Xenorhabdus sp. PB62.4]|uniref:hypothetical protein n=1 Tax=Xenorhabdus sp. PB62.4 TaxID=1851573 RepID=UPI0016570AB5|nr:hypothetical protein [Xenorhabdus sp. PB62.4]MBC8953608.1 hypothetical protein [Xenorhabdus sp. PB62.4]
MFKKLLTVGTLLAGITLTGGVGATSESVTIPWHNCSSSPEEYNNGLYTKYLVKEGIVFLDVRNENGIRWYLKGFKKLYGCGMNVYVAKYEGRKS